MAKMPKRPAKPESETIEIAHIRAADFRVLFSDHVLVRLNGGVMSMTFAVDDQFTTAEAAVLTSKGEQSRTYTIVGRTEIQRRVELVEIRMTAPEALSLAKVLVDKVASENPEILGLKGIVVQPKNGGEKVS